jgi:hypothetical protein
MRIERFERLCPESCGPYYAKGLCLTHYFEQYRRNSGVQPRPESEPKDQMWTIPVSTRFHNALKAKVGPRGMSAFIRAAVEEKMAREFPRDPTSHQPPELLPEP